MNEPYPGASLIEPAPDTDPHWARLMDAGRDAGCLPADSAIARLYGPLCQAHARGPFAIGHLAQSLDGCIATVGGMSRWLSGDADLLHTHRMRALSDAVLVGVNTVLADDPQLTVRRCVGAHPVRVVIDPERRLLGSERLLNDGAAQTLVLVARDRATVGEAIGAAEIVPLPRSAQGLDPHEIRRILAQRGLSWLFIEGGGDTVSRFLAAGALDRLQITVTPVIIGSGRPGIRLPEITDLRDSLRPKARRFSFDDDVMIECDFRD